VAIREHLDPLPLLMVALVLAYALATGAQLASAEGRAALLRLLGLIRDSSRRTLSRTPAEQGT
jgi:hypothetical protein